MNIGTPKFTVLTNYGTRADGLFDYYEEAVRWAVTLIKGSSEILTDNVEDENIYLDNSDYCRVIPLVI